MPLDINGACRSRSLACLLTARGTVAPTRGQVPGGVLLGTRSILGGVWGSRAERRTRRLQVLQSRGLRGFRGFQEPPVASKTSRGLQNPGAGQPSDPATLRGLNRLQGPPGLQGPPPGASGACRSLSPFSSSQDFQRTQMKRCCC